MRPLKPPAPGRLDLAARFRWIQCYGPPVATLRHVLQVMAYHDNDQGSGCWVSIETLAAETALCQRTVQYALHDLCGCGWAAPDLKPDRDGKHHSNKGGRGHTTRYRIVYRDVPTETPQRVHRLTDRRIRPVSGAKGATVATKGATVAGNGATVADNGRNGCTRSSPDPQDPALIRGGPPPEPPSDGAAAPPLVADAPAVRPLPRAVLAAEAQRHGCWVEGPAGAQWTDLLEQIGVAWVSEVRWTVFQLAKARRAEHPDTGLLPPYHVDQLAPYAVAVAAALITYRADLAQLKGRVA